MKNAKNNPKNAKNNQKNLLFFVPPCSLCTEKRQKPTLFSYKNFAPAGPVFGRAYTKKGLLPLAPLKMSRNKCA